MPVGQLHHFELRASTKQKMPTFSFPYCAALSVDRIRAARHIEQLSLERLWKKINRAAFMA